MRGICAHGRAARRSGLTTVEGETEVEQTSDISHGRAGRENVVDEAAAAGTNELDGIVPWGTQMEEMDLATCEVAEPSAPNAGLSSGFLASRSGRPIAMISLIFYFVPVIVVIAASEARH